MLGFGLEFVDDRVVGLLLARRVAVAVAVAVETSCSGVTARSTLGTTGLTSMSISTSDSEEVSDFEDWHSSRKPPIKLLSDWCPISLDEIVLASSATLINAACKSSSS